MKQLLCVLLIAVMLVGFIACNPTAADTTEANGNPATTAQNETDPATTVYEDTTNKAPESETTANEDTTAPATTAAPITTAEPDTTAEDTTAPETDPPATTPPVTTTPVTEPPVTTVPVTEPPKENTAKPKVVSTAATAPDRIAIYGTVENGSVIKSWTNTDATRNKDESNGPNFIIEISGTAGTTVKLSLTATAPGKLESDTVTVDITFNGTGMSNVWVGRNSRLFYMPTLGYMQGNVKADRNALNHAVGKTKTLLQNVRAATGKNTKLVYLLIPNPSNVYFDEQRNYMYAGGMSKTTPPVSVMTQFVAAMKGNKDIIVPDLFAKLYPHKDEMIYFRTDTHYTELGAYYCYEELMDAVLVDFPKAKVRKINTDYTVEYPNAGGGDMVSMSGLHGVCETFPTFVAKFQPTGTYYNSKRNDGIKVAGFGPSGWTKDSTINSSNPTAYVIGDSYGCYILPFIGANFSKVWTNDGVLWNYTVDYNLLSVNKPDYLVFVYCERNIDAGCNNLLNP